MYRWMPGILNAATTVVERAMIFVRQTATDILLISVVLWTLATYLQVPDEARLSAEAAERINALLAASQREILPTETDRVIAQELLV